MTTQTPIHPEDIYAAAWRAQNRKDKIAVSKDRSRFNRAHVTTVNGARVAVGKENEARVLDALRGRSDWITARALGLAIGMNTKTAATVLARLRGKDAVAWDTKIINGTHGYVYRAKGAE